MIKLASPDIKKEDILKANEVLTSGNLIQGENVACFENELVKFSGIKHCAVVSSGTAALHLSLKSLDISQGDSVIVPAFTFPATANAVLNTGADIILCDVAESTYVVTPDLIEKTISENQQKRIKAIIVVHEFGYPADIKAIREISSKYNLKLIEDAACALGTVANNHHPGYYSNVACFSFHPRKAITAGEGGAVLSNDKDIVEKVKILRNHGMQKTDQGLDFIASGLNCRMTDFQAALARGQLSRFPEELTNRKNLAALYQDLLNSDKNLRLPQISQGHSWQSYMIVLQEKIDRDSIIRAMAAEGIETNLGAQALNELTFFRKKYGFAARDFNTANTLYKSGLALPIYGKLEFHVIEFISQTLKEVLNGF